MKNMDSLRSVREEALRLGQHMVDAKIIRQQTDKKGVFQDSKSVMYRWKKVRY